MAKILIYVGSSLPLLWGIAHLFPTRSIVKGFGEISEDNKNILTMEWLIEGIALIFIGISVAMITAIEPQHMSTPGSCFFHPAINIYTLQSYFIRREKRN
jgi:hypothetical protein